jgi:hypothetical protein
MIRRYYCLLLFFVHNLTGSIRGSHYYTGMYSS